MACFLTGRVWHCVCSPAEEGGAAEAEAPEKSKKVKSKKDKVCVCGGGGAQRGCRGQEVLKGPVGSAHM